MLNISSTMTNKSIKTMHLESMVELKAHNSLTRVQLF